MIALKINSTVFYEQLEAHILVGKSILKGEISNPNILEKEMDEWERNAIHFLESTTVNLPESLISDFQYAVTENRIMFKFISKEFKHNPSSHIAYLTKHLNNKIQVLKKTSDYLSVSDMLKEIERKNVSTIQEKILFVLQKLYLLYNDNFYSISMIFDVNEIEYRDNEPIEIAENLRKRGYGIRESDYSTKDLLKISVKGAAYIERQNKILENNSRKNEEVKINDKINLVLYKLEELGYGQQIIFEEIEELRGLSKNLSKKTFSQVIKGKVVDLALSELISKDIATFIYESLVDDKFKLLQ